MLAGPLLGFTRRHWPLVLATAALAGISTAEILRRTGGEAAVPLDDAYIHFQYARSFANLEPFVYTPGAAPTPGTTSLLWPLLLAPFFFLGLDGVAIIWPAWILGWVSLGLLAHETHRLARGLVSTEVSVAASAMVLVFGGNVWFAASGMEVIPFAWVLARTARRAAEWGEASGESPALAELCLLGGVGPLVRPEGILCSGLVAGALLVHPRRRSRLWAIVPIAGVFLPALVLWLATGQASSTAAAVKWLPASPYYRGRALVDAVLDNVCLLFGTLFDGRQWSSVFLPAGGRSIAVCALVAIPVLGWLQRRPWRAACTLAIALGMLIPTTYDSFLWNRLRYLWPFAPAWFVGLAALGELAGTVAAGLRADWAGIRLLAAGFFVGALAGHLSYSIDDLATSADAIRRQQVALGRWARDALPDGSVLGVNDTGAIAYFSRKPVFDVVGLTTRGEAPYWVAGAGSRFEHYEKMGRSALPTHFIVYEDWLQSPQLLGSYLTRRSVPGATILGGTTMVAHEAAYTALGAAGMPAETYTGSAGLLDVLDVADLESESAHDYELFWATQTTDVVVGDHARADGGRSKRTLDRFILKIAPAATLVARLGAERPGDVKVRVDGRFAGSLKLVGEEWEEPALRLPPLGVPPGDHVIEIESPAGTTFTSMKYWSFR